MLLADAFSNSDCHNLYHLPLCFESAGSSISAITSATPALSHGQTISAFLCRHSSRTPSGKTLILRAPTCPPEVVRSILAVDGMLRRIGGPRPTHMWSDTVANKKNCHKVSYRISNALPHMLARDYVPLDQLGRLLAMDIWKSTSWINSKGSLR